MNIGHRSAGLKENTYTGHLFSESATKALLRSPYIPEEANNKAGENPQPEKQEKSVWWKVPGPIRGKQLLNNHKLEGLVGRRGAMENPGPKSGAKSSCQGYKQLLAVAG